MITGIKERLTDPLRLPYNFIMGPIIGWDAPKAFVSDMGFLTMPQLVLSAAIGGNSPAKVLCAGANSACNFGPGGSHRSAAVGAAAGGEEASSTDSRPAPSVGSVARGRCGGLWFARLGVG